MLNKLICDLNKEFAPKNYGIQYFMGIEAHHDVIRLYLTQFKYVTNPFEKHK